MRSGAQAIHEWNGKSSTKFYSVQWIEPSKYIALKTNVWFFTDMNLDGGDLYHPFVEFVVRFKCMVTYPWVVGKLRTAKWQTDFYCFPWNSMECQRTYISLEKAWFICLVTPAVLRLDLYRKFCLSNNDRRIIWLRHGSNASSVLQSYGMLKLWLRKIVNHSVVHDLVRILPVRHLASSHFTSSLLSSSRCPVYPWP